MDKEELEVLLDAREARIVELEAENKQLKARVIGNPARNLPPPAPIATTNREFWGLDTIREPFPSIKFDASNVTALEEANALEAYAREITGIKTIPPIKCANCEE